MIVPFAKGQAQSTAPAQAKPSETDMLMALATMHQMGRIPKPSKVSTTPTETPSGA